jgi:hypothetical protein
LQISSSPGDLEARRHSRQGLDHTEEEREPLEEHQYLGLQQKEKPKMQPLMEVAMARKISTKLHWGLATLDLYQQQETEGRLRRQEAMQATMNL